MAILEEKNLTVIRKNGTLPSVPFLAIKDKLLGKKYDLTLTFCSPSESQNLNRTYREKDYPTNILSFPLDDNQGEIYIQLSVARKDAHKFDMSYEKFLHLLFIHGCLHLKGHDHSDHMEAEEEKYLKYFYK